MSPLQLALLVALAASASSQREVFPVHKYQHTSQRSLFPTPVEVGIYYEAQCPDSQEFIVDQLLPAYEKAPKLITPVFIPYGKAETIKTPTGYELICQHGPSECEGNKIHACAIDLLRGKKIQLKYIACMMSDYVYPELIGERCAKLFGINWTFISRCSRGIRGSELLRAYGEATRSLDPPVTFIPTVTLNGSQANQTDILNDLWGVLCRIFEEPVPHQCMFWYHRIFG